jgi:hypothetical protein
LGRYYFLLKNAIQNPKTRNPKPVKKFNLLDSAAEIRPPIMRISEIIIKKIPITNPRLLNLLYMILLFKRK